MTMCFLEGLSDEEVVERLVARGAALTDARRLVERRDDDDVHDALHSLLAGS